jgi:hypothetical protein
MDCFTTVRALALRVWNWRRPDARKLEGYEMQIDELLAQRAAQELRRDLNRAAKNAVLTEMYRLLSLRDGFAVDSLQYSDRFAEADAKAKEYKLCELATDRDNNNLLHTAQKIKLVESKCNELLVRMADKDIVRKSRLYNVPYDIQELANDQREAVENENMDAEELNNVLSDTMQVQKDFNDKRAEGVAHASDDVVGRLRAPAPMARDDDAAASGGGEQHSSAIGDEELEKMIKAAPAPPKQKLTKFILAKPSVPYVALS